jgi:hypothetical protein
MDIIPADILGMEYATRGNICDHEVSSYSRCHHSVTNDLSLLQSVLTVFAGPDIDKIFAMQASIVSTSGNFTSIWQMTDGYAYELATLEISEDGVDQSITSESPRCGYSNNHSIKHSISALVRHCHLWIFLPMLIYASSYASQY